MIRQAAVEDLPQILPIYEKAREFMRETGNPTQWAGGYPAQELLEGDIAAGDLYVMRSDEGIPYGVFMLHYGPDPCYQVIENGQWIDESSYATIHRIASDGTHSRIFHKAVEFAKQKYLHLRVDTHEDNKPMQRAIKREGFVYCGVVHMMDGTPRFAYEWIAPILKSN